MQTEFSLFLLTQEGRADVSARRPAVSLFSSCFSRVAKVLPHTALAFLFFLRVGLQQEGHLQASSK